MALVSCARCSRHHAPGTPCPHCATEPTWAGGRALTVLLGLAITGSGCFVGQTLYGGPDTVDADGDGVWAGQDCDDGDPAVHPGATETAGDGVDSDCDGQDDPAGTGE